MKIKSKVRAGRACGAIKAVQSSLRIADCPYPKSPRSSTMKIKSKVRAGRLCGTKIVQSVVCIERVILPNTKELDMKIKSKVRAGRACGPKAIQFILIPRNPG